MLHPVFYDFEANGLEGFPIEVGFAFVDDQNNIVSGSLLIKPDAEWDIANDWDADAQQIHGISPEQLISEGISALQVAQRLNQTLAGRDLYSDSSFDRKWMGQLFDAAGLVPTFELKVTLAPTIIDNLRSELGFTEDDVAVLFRRADHEAPHVDRAGPDARHLAAKWAGLLTFQLVG
jgi:hypothetical protein